MPGSKKSSSKSGSSRGSRKSAGSRKSSGSPELLFGMSPSSPVSVPVSPQLVVPSPMGTPEAVIVNGVDGPIVVEASSVASGTPNVMSLLRVPVEGPPGSYSQSNARQRRLAMWRAREPVRVNISPRARWSSRSEGRGRGKGRGKGIRTKRFPEARMRGWPRTPPGIGMIPMLPPPLQGPMRERDWTRRNIPAYYIQRYREDRAGREGMNLSPISPSSVDVRRLIKERGLWSSRSRSRHSPRSRSSSRHGVPMMTLSPAGQRRTLRMDKQFRFRDDDDDRRHHREWRKTKKQLKRMIGHKVPKGASSSSSTSSSSN